MTDGIAENVTVFGRTFYIQTDICHGALRTEIFLGGRLIATRDARLDGAERQGDEDVQRLRMNEHHQQVVAGILERARRYQQRRLPSPGARAKLRDRGRDARAAGVGEDGKPNPAAVRRESVELGMRIRELLRDFRRRIATGGENEVERLERASPAFASILTSPLFAEIRIDEQLRIHLLQDQIHSWQRDGRDPRRAAELGRDLATFSAYLEGIDDRAELAFALGGATPSVADARTREQPGAPASSAIGRQEIRALRSPQPGSSQKSTAGSLQENSMAKVSLEPLTAIDGFIGSCLVDSDSGMMLGAQGGGPVNLELAAAGNTQVVRAKRKTMDSLRLNDRIEDILISLGKQYHLIRPLESTPTIFLYLVLDRGKANLAMARHELRTFESSLSLG